jgi:hypothetical protein
MTYTVNGICEAIGSKTCVWANLPNTFENSIDTTANANIPTILTTKKIGWLGIKKLVIMSPIVMHAMIIGNSLSKNVGITLTFAATASTLEFEWPVVCILWKKVLPMSIATKVTKTKLNMAPMMNPMSPT